MAAISRELEVPAPLTVCVKGADEGIEYAVRVEGRVAPARGRGVGRQHGRWRRTHPSRHGGGGRSRRVEAGLIGGRRGDERCRQGYQGGQEQEPRGQRDTTANLAGAACVSLACGRPGIWVLTASGPARVGARGNRQALDPPDVLLSLFVAGVVHGAAVPAAAEPGDGASLHGIRRRCGNELTCYAGLVPAAAVWSIRAQPSIMD